MTTINGLKNRIRLQRSRLNYIEKELAELEATKPKEVEKFIGYVNGIYNSISFGKKSGCGCVSMYCESLSNLYEKYINEPKRF